MDLSQQPGQPWLRFSVALPLGINGRTASFTGSLYPTFLFDVGGRSLRGPRQRQLRASAAGRRSTTHSSLVGSSASGECNELRRVAVRRWRRTARLYESHKLDSFVLGRAPRRPPSAFAALRGRRRFLTESRYSLSAPNSPQFSVLYPPHCGSAIAPPRYRRPLEFHLDFAHCKASEIPL